MNGASFDRDDRGFTLIELLVVLAIIATLLALAMPRYMRSVEKSKEAVLKENLWVMRDALDKYHGDTGKYPDTLDDLVTKKYLRSIPLDPLTESVSTWEVVPPADPEQGAVYDVRSGASGVGLNGVTYHQW
jgi:general secretion pathway protein G